MTKMTHAASQVILAQHRLGSKPNAILEALGDEYPNASFSKRQIADVIAAPDRFKVISLAGPIWSVPKKCVPISHKSLD